MAKTRVPVMSATQILAKKEQRRLAKNRDAQNYRARKKARRMTDQDPVTMEGEDETMADEESSPGPENESAASEAIPEPEQQEQEQISEEDLAAARLARLAAAVAPAPTVSIYDYLNQTLATLPLRAPPTPKVGDMWIGDLHVDKSLRSAQTIEKAPTKTIETAGRLAEEVTEAEDEDLGVLDEELGFFDREFEAIMAAREIDKRMEERRNEVVEEVWDWEMEED